MSLGLAFWNLVEAELHQCLSIPGALSDAAKERAARRRKVLVRMARALAVEEATMESDIRKVRSASSLCTLNFLSLFRLVPLSLRQGPLMARTSAVQGTRRPD